MPEGPEIRRAADKIAKVLEGKAIDRIEFAFAHLKPFSPILITALASTRTISSTAAGMS
jgi:endonuclease-8